MWLAPSTPQPAKRDRSARTAAAMKAPSVGWGRRHPRSALLGVLIGVVVCVSGCRVEMVVRIDSDELGAGRISVTAELDRDVAVAVLAPSSANTIAASEAQATQPVARIQLEDVRQAGWEGPGLVRNADESARFALSHRFRNVAEANALIDQMSGARGPLAGLRLERTRTPLSTSITLSGPGNFRDGLAAFGDDQLTSATGNGPFGLTDAEVLRQSNGASLDDVFSLRLDANLIDKQKSWRLPIGSATQVRSGARSTSWATIGGGVGALGAVIALVVLQRRSGRPSRANDDGGTEDGPSVVDAAQPVPIQGRGV